MSETIAWHEGSRDDLRQMFELADDSREQIDKYVRSLAG